MKKLIDKILITLSIIGLAICACVVIAVFFNIKITDNDMAEFALSGSAGVVLTSLRFFTL